MAWPDRIELAVATAVVVAFVAFAVVPGLLQLLERKPDQARKGPEAVTADDRAPIRLRDGFAARAAVGRWLRTKALHENGTPYDRGTLMQLAADAEHSSLLLRLFAGQKPCAEPPDWENPNPCPEEQGGKP